MERQSSHFIFCLMFFIKICTDFETLPLKSLFAGFTADEWDCEWNLTTAMDIFLSSDILV